MKKDLFKELGMAADKAILNEEEMLCVKGGVAPGPVIIPQNGLRCNVIDNTVRCIKNVCDPTNCGACPGNTIGGGPRTCPLSA